MTSIGHADRRSPQFERDKVSGRLRIQATKQKSDLIKQRRALASANGVLRSLSDRRSVRRSMRVWTAVAIGLVIGLRVLLSWIASMVDPQPDGQGSSVETVGSEQ